MKIIYVITIYLCTTLTSCNHSNKNKVNKNIHVLDTNYETIANITTKEVALRLKKEKGLQCIGSGGRMMNDIQRMGVSFQLFHEVDFTEARRLLVYVTTEYLNAINNNKEIRPYLHNYPFKPENVEIMIWIQEPNGQDVPFEKIDFMSSIDAILEYKVATGQEPYSNKKIHEETYEKALKIVQEEDIANQNKVS